jgi:DNA-binding FadR family transcriptional regulator
LALPPLDIAAATTPLEAAKPHGEEAASVAEASPSRNANDFLATALGHDIVAGTYPAGTLLPSESRLLARFDVSRPTLREALRVLGAKGLILSRRKIGTRVRPKTDWNMLDPDILAWHLQVAPSEEFVTALFELREMIEPQAAALAARACDAATLERIAAAYVDMARFANGGGDLIGADLRFHQSILESTGNHFIGALGGLIKTALIATFRLGWQSPVAMQENRLAQHRLIMEAIAKRDADAAHARMAELLHDSIEDVRGLLRESGEAATAPSQRQHLLAGAPSPETAKAEAGR